MLSLVDWDSVTKLKSCNAANNRVLDIFQGFYDIAFLKQKIKTKNKALKSPWKSRDLQRCTKRKQKLYEIIERCKMCYTTRKYETLTNDIFLICTCMYMHHIWIMVILHGSAHPRINIKRYLLNKNMLFQLYFMKKKKLK